MWLYAMINESCDQPPFYSDVTVKQILNEMLINMRGIVQEDITSDNCRDIYIELIEVFNNL